MGVIVSTSLVGKAKLDRDRFLALVAALAQDHYAEGPYFVISGPGSSNLNPFLGTEDLRYIPNAELLVDNSSIEQVRDAIHSSSDTDLAIGFGWVRSNDDWDLELGEAQDLEEREEMVQDLHEEAQRSSDACGALYHCGGTVEFRIVGKAAPAELEYGDKSFFRWLTPWFGKVRHRVRMD